MAETLRVLAGDCTVTYEDSAGRSAAGSRAEPGDDADRRRERGHLLTQTESDYTEKLRVDRSHADASSVFLNTTSYVREDPNGYTDRVHTNG